MKDRHPSAVMYQLEVKRHLVEYQFPPADGWEVTVNVDAVEGGRGGQDPPDEPDRAGRTEAWLENQGVRISAHPEFGRADLVATKPRVGIVVVEVEGGSSKQP